MLKSNFLLSTLTEWFFVILISTRTFSIKNNIEEVIQPADHNTIFDAQFLSVISTINNEIKICMFGVNPNLIDYPLLSQDDITLLSKPCENNNDCIKKKMSSLDNLNRALQSLECFHVFLNLQILNVLKNDIKIKQSNPVHASGMKSQHLNFYTVKMLSFFTYGKFVVSPWQYNLAMKIIDMAKLEQQNKDTIEVRLEYFDDPVLLNSMNEFCENCKKNNEFLASIISILSITQDSLFRYPRNLMRCVRKLFSKINIPILTRMDKISHILIKNANGQNVEVDKDLEQKKQDFLKSLELNKSEIVSFERNTVGNMNVELWSQLRGKRLSAHNFYRASRSKATTNKTTLIRTAMHIKLDKPDVAETENIQRVHMTLYGYENEGKAREQYEKEMNVKIEPCGIFIDEDLNYLSAKPDGLIGGNAIVEVKCPYNAKDMTPEDAIKKKIIKYVHYDGHGILRIKRSAETFYQIQGELHITQRQYCYLIIWTPKGMVHLEVMRDDKFWKDTLEKNLIDFYLNHMLPEIVSPKLSGSLKIQNN